MRISISMNTVIKNADSGAEIKRDGSNKNTQVYCSKGRAEAVANALTTVGYRVSSKGRIVDVEGVAK